MARKPSEPPKPPGPGKPRAKAPAKPAGRIATKAGLTVVEGGRGRGAPPHLPTETSRTLVQVACMTGFSQQQIARLLKIDKNTLVKHYREELDQGGDALMVKVVANLAAIATKVDHPKAVTAGIWLTRARLGWGAKDAVRGGGDEDDPDGEDGERLAGTVFTLKLDGKRGNVT